MDVDEPIDLARVADRWDRTVRERAVNPIQGWLDSPIVLESYVQPLVSGSPQTNWLIGIARRLQIPTNGRWLSLGCGSAGQELLAAREGLFSSLVAYDASIASLDQGRAAAIAQGVENVEFRLGNMDQVEFPHAAYDVVMMNMSLHHVKELRPLLSKIRRTLTPDGFFVINEFIGPRQFQFTDFQLGIVKELLAILPARWRLDIATGALKSEYHKFPIEHWNIADPSEAIRSDLIVPEIKRQFQVVVRKDYGGTILNLLLEHIVHNFDTTDEKDVAALRLLAKCEELLVRHAVLPSDFTVLVMRKKRLDRFAVRFSRLWPAIAR